MLTSTPVGEPVIVVPDIVREYLRRANLSRVARDSNVSRNTLKKMVDRGTAQRDKVQAVVELAGVGGRDELLLLPSTKKSLANQNERIENPRPSDQIRDFIATTNPTGGRPVATILHDLVALLDGTRGKEAAELFAEMFDEFRDMPDGTRRLERAARIVVTAFAKVDHDRSAHHGEESR